MKTHAEISKFLSYILRHNPEYIGITLDQEGWANIHEIVNKSEMDLNYNFIKEVVKTNKKRRFSISNDGLYIRANQGHSINVNLGLEPKCPPDILYHGTAERFLKPIQREGLKSGQRQYVQLSTDIDTATAVGKRHGKPVILEINSVAMHQQGHEFFLSDNGVWLTMHVPNNYLKLYD